MLNFITLVMAGLLYFLLMNLGPIIRDPEATRILSMTAPLWFGFLVALGLPGIFSLGIGLLMRKSWGRYLAIIVGILNLPNLPIGTALGIYSLWVLFKTEAVEYFVGEPGGRHPPMQSLTPTG
ncbi:MAG: hypothetical protein R2856_01910 [Caldilineaceae bacterium]